MASEFNFKGILSLEGQIEKLTKESNSLKKDIENLRELNKRLINMIYYSPGGKGFTESENHFNDLASNLP